MVITSVKNGDQQKNWEKRLSPIEWFKDYLGYGSPFSIISAS